MTPAALTITANNKTQGLRRGAAGLTASYSGFVNGDTAASLTHAADAGHHGHGQQPCRGNPYPITASGAADANYTISYVAGTLTVTPAALTITADNKSKVYGAALPALTASYSGFVNGDTAASLSTPPTLDHHGHGRPVAWAALPDHGQRGGGCELHDQLRRRHADGDTRRC